MQSAQPDGAFRQTKVFLRRGGGLLYTQDGAWTPHVDLAKDFKEASGALMFGRACGVQGLEIVIWTMHGESTLPISG